VIKFSFELGAWAGIGLIVWLLCRQRPRLARRISWIAALASAPLLWMTFDPEGSIAVADFLSRAWVGLLFGAVGGAVSGSAIAATFSFPKDRNRRAAIVVFLLAGLFIAFSERKSEILHPFKASRYNIWKGEVCLQTTRATCGPASLATCLHALGLPENEAELALDANTAADGTLFADLARAARVHGVKAEFCDHRQPNDVALPAIASVTMQDGMDHFVAVILRHGKRCVGDPADGIHPLNSNRYRWSGMFLCLSR
jgi:hypothetical protein